MPQTFNGVFLGVSKMVNGKFGIELECFNVDTPVVVRALRDAGIYTESAGYAGRAYDLWQIKPDCSIQGRFAFEVVSPILEGEAGIATARKVCEILVALGAKVNKSCGFHIHHNARTWNIAQFRNLFKRFVKFEGALDSIQPESRRDNNNRFCKSVKNGLPAEGMFAAIDACKNIRALSALYSDSRYFKLNLQSFFRMGSVEFRNHAGTVDADKVEQYIRLTYAMVADAESTTTIKPFATTTSAKDALDVMLSGMVRRAVIGKATAAFYKNRANKFTEEVAA